MHRALLEAGLAQPFRWLPHWVFLPVTSAAAAQLAVWLYRLNYDRRQGAPVADLVARVEAQGRLARLSTPSLLK